LKPSSGSGRFVRKQRFGKIGVTARIKAEGAGYDDIMSRAIEGRFIFGTPETGVFRQLMRKLETFSRTDWFWAARHLSKEPSRVIVSGSGSSAKQARAR